MLAKWADCNELTAVRRRVTADHVKTQRSSLQVSARQRTSYKKDGKHVYDFGIKMMRKPMKSFLGD